MFDPVKGKIGNILASIVALLLLIFNATLYSISYFKIRRGRKQLIGSVGYTVVIK